MSIWDLNNFLWLQKLKRNFNQNPLHYFHRFLLMCAMHLQQFITKDGLIFSQASVCYFDFLVESSHQNKSMYPPSGAGPAS